MHTESENIQDNLRKSEVIDYDYKLIADKCTELKKDTEDEVILIKKIYESVRDEIRHSGYIGRNKGYLQSVRVLEFGHGIYLY